MAFEPAPLDKMSWENGVAKYVHPQRAVEAPFYDYAVAVLDYFFPNIKLHSQVRPREEAVLAVTSGDHASKASGFPWNYMGATTKKQSYELFGNQFDGCEFHILTATLKDELRPIGKDARLFRMQSTHDYMEGFQLFDVQNEFLASRKFGSPLFIKYITPGTDITRLFELLVHHAGSLHDADGSQWDATFPLMVAEIICYWRSRFMSDVDKKRVKRYYRNMYNGYTNVAGTILHLVGQSSGHFNTTTDNSLGNVIAMSYVAYKNGLSVRDFSEQCRFYVCGDDLVWSNRSVFTPQEVGVRYGDLGFLMEFGSLEPTALEDLSFVGVTPVVLDRIRYHGRLDKFQASCYYKKRSNTVRDIIAKMCSITAMSFYSPMYDTFYQMTYKYLNYVSTFQPHWLLDLDVAASLRTIEPEFLRRLYNQWESSFSLSTERKKVLKGHAAF